MKRSTILTLITIAAVWASSAAAATAALAPESRLELDGTSNVHDWEAKTKELRVSLTFPAATSLTAAVDAQSPAALTVAIPVKALKSPHSGLDENMQKALKAEKFPDITFALDNYQLSKDASGETIVAAGRLSVAGVEKPATLKAALSRRDGRLVVDGEQPLQMTDFGVKPPTFMLGALKAGDRVVVKYHLELLPGDDLKSNGK